jgi:hypothetical protein
MPTAQPSSSKDAVLLGKNTITGQSVHLSQTARRQGTYVIGKNGTGKTTFLVNLMLQDIRTGMGLCFIDPHGDAITDLLRRLPQGREQDVILLDVLDTDYPFGLNLYECADITDLELVTRTASQVMHLFEKVWGASSKSPSWGPAMEDLLRNIAFTFIYAQGLTLAEVPLILTDEIAREKVVASIQNSQLRLFWNQFAWRKDKNEYMASTLNKVRAFLSNPLVEHIVGQAHATIDFRTIMDQGKILLVKLPGRYEDVTSLIGGVLISQLLNAALSRVNIPAEQRRQFNLYVDEYQHFCTPDMATLLAESRKYALATTICHQFLDQLDSINRGATLNAANMVVFRISGQDAEELAKEFDATPPPPDVIGQRPILTPKRDVIDHLLKNGHSNPAYMRGAKVLLGLTEAAGTRIDQPQFRHITNILQPENMILAFRQYKAGRQYAESVQLQEDVKVLLQRLNNLFYEVMRERNPLKRFILDDLVILLRVTNLYDLVKHVPPVIVLLGSPDSAAIQRGVDYLYQATVTAREKRGNVELFCEMGNSLRLLMRVLAAEPILVDSGQHAPIYDKPRTYADVQNQIATDLANLKPFHAKCKLGHQEELLQTQSLPRVIHGAVIDYLTAALQKTTRLRYCKARRDVEEEMRVRQEKLIEQEEKKRTSKEEETI